MDQRRDYLFLNVWFVCTASTHNIQLFVWARLAHVNCIVNMWNKCARHQRWFFLFLSRRLVGIGVCGVFVLIINLQRTKWSTDLFTLHHRRHHHHHQRYHRTWNQIECDIVIHLPMVCGHCHSAKQQSENQSRRKKKRLSEKKLEKETTRGR